MQFALCRLGNYFDHVSLDLMPRLSWHLKRCLINIFAGFVPTSPRPVLVLCDALRLRNVDGLTWNQHLTHRNSMPQFNCEL